MKYFIFLFLLFFIIILQNKDIVNSGNQKQINLKMLYQLYILWVYTSIQYFISIYSSNTYHCISIFGCALIYINVLVLIVFWTYTIFDLVQEDTSNITSIVLKKTITNPSLLNKKDIFDLLMFFFIGDHASINLLTICLNMKFNAFLLNKKTLNVTILLIIIWMINMYINYAINIIDVKKSIHDLETITNDLILNGNYNDFNVFFQNKEINTYCKNLIDNIHNNIDESLKIKFNITVSPPMYNKDFKTIFYKMINKKITDIEEFKQLLYKYPNYFINYYLYYLTPVPYEFIKPFFDLNDKNAIIYYHITYLIMIGILGILFFVTLDGKTSQLL